MGESIGESVSKLILELKEFINNYKSKIMFGLFKNKSHLLELKVTAIGEDHYIGRYKFLTRQQHDIEYQRLILGLITKMCAIEISNISVTREIKDYLKTITNLDEFNHSTVSTNRPHHIDILEEGKFPLGKDVKATLIYKSNALRHINTQIPQTYYRYQMFCTIVVAIELATQKLDDRNLKSLQNGIKYILDNCEITFLGIFDATRLQNEAFLLKEKF